MEPKLNRAQRRREEKLKKKRGFGTPLSEVGAVIEGLNPLETESLVTTREGAISLQHAIYDVYFNRQVYTPDTEREVLRALYREDQLHGESSYRFRGLVGDVKYGYIDEKGIEYRNVVNAICIMFPEIRLRAHGADSPARWYDASSHLWLSLKDTHIDWDEHGEMDVALGDTLTFLGCVKPYKSKGSNKQRYGIGMWQAEESELKYYYGKKIRNVPRELVGKNAIVWGVKRAMKNGVDGTNEYRGVRKYINRHLSEIKSTGSVVLEKTN